MKTWSKARVSRAAEFVALMLQLGQLDPKAFARTLRKVRKLAPKGKGVRS